MTDTADVPAPYIDEEASAPKSEIELTLNGIVDRLVHPEEAGKISSGRDDSHQELRNQRWNRLQNMFEELVEELAEKESVYGLQMGYLNGVDQGTDHPIGLAIALRHSPKAAMTGLIPNKILNQTRDEQLRLVKDEKSNTEQIRAFGFVLPKLTTDTES